VLKCIAEGHRAIVGKRAARHGRNIDALNLYPRGVWGEEESAREQRERKGGRDEEKEREREREREREKRKNNLIRVPLN